MRLVVAMTGASGQILGQRVLEELAARGDCEVHLVVTRGAQLTIEHELPAERRELPAAHRHSEGALDAPIASSSFLTDAMVVVPCSMKTLAAIAHGLSDNLVTRAADIHLRTKRRLVIVPRETPLSAMGIENMLRVAQAGAIVLPPMLSYYNRPTTLSDATNFVVGKILDALQIETKVYRRWE
ncbi:MAG TPA: UbiX family flavin prenyltransferase [Candidatus Thermoplasmatota archaeon]|nr:UbiX family flavin prenyltransferase [Candidatus Thermoplasmatota archaeon]